MKKKENFYQNIKIALSAKDKLVQYNLKLVLKYAYKYRNRGLEVLDLFQEGTIGLMQAIDYFDLSRDNKFSTYAVYYIIQSMSRAIDNKGRNIRIPVHKKEKFNKYCRVRETLEQTLGREPTNIEIALEMNVSLETLENTIAGELNDTISLNTLVKDGEDTELEHFVSNLEKPVEEVVMDNLLSDEIKRLLNDCDLNDREKMVISLRFGLTGDVIWPLDKIGTQLGLTRERVRQLEAKAIRKIRHSKHIKKFAEYMDSPEQALENIREDRIRIRDYQGHNRYTKVYDYKVPNSQKQIKSKDRRSENMARKIPSLYEYLNKKTGKDYTQEQIKIAMESLTPGEVAIFNLRYQDDYTTVQATGDWDTSKSQLLYQNIIPKLIRRLEKPGIKRIGVRKGSRTDLLNKEETVTKETSTEIISSKEDVKKQQKANSEVPKQEVESTVEQQEEKISESKEKQEMSKEDYISMLEMLRTPMFRQMMDNLSPKEVMIVSLKLGYYDNKYFSTESIANFLEIPCEEVRETTKNVLLKYQESFTTFMNEAIAVATDNNVDANSFKMLKKYKNTKWNK